MCNCLRLRDDDSKPHGKHVAYVDRVGLRLGDALAIENCERNGLAVLLGLSHSARHGHVVSARECDAERLAIATCASYADG